MKVLPVRLSEAAISSLADLATYIATSTGSLDVALSFTDRIERRCTKIGRAPNGGSPRADLGDDVRLVPFERSAVILYRTLEDHVEIIDVIYGGRDYNAIMLRKS
ncbi:type II toxin-antitoxin system RelE/ParE family toxin [Jiella endophytica]|uniref:Type II toxin-antitoxin system RelE/ParE family toxin n=1 Tax=Jiella endophytica TaxID=2558362 RepID=A0A4Y8REK8_9HYPH|nr:type II toxin-antitoxin system RelE/ParE family toxin [Jiella endophytica]TFF20712.1 type II toxin-antitoxin system RelE/ParE family toxin [Jiella endophytica]TFF27013.1 type II toxin-antitoxin system RelE/ParE family toxin [Jiella endophytica]